MNAISPVPCDNELARGAASRSREPRADGRFVYAMTTTGVLYCPTRLENVRFRDNPALAEAADFARAKAAGQTCPRWRSGRGGIDRNRMLRQREDVD